ncbi:MAG TPA: ribonuclease HII [Atribacteraceae bacterium]|nr:ribonuclease HII [Atribacteraceae bacterium]
MLEDELWARGIQRIAGIDEAGRGSLAGPLVAACVVFAGRSDLTLYRDSKKLQPNSRERLFDRIIQKAESVGIGMADERLIDLVGIQRANRHAFREALDRAFSRPAPDYLLLDWLALPGIPIPSMVLSKAESRSFTVAAASIVAKVWRDRIMKEWYHASFPQYGFSAHKGYGTRLHRERISCFGLSDAHRRSFCGKYEKDSSYGTERRSGGPALYRETLGDESIRN